MKPDQGRPPRVTEALSAITKPMIDRFEENNRNCYQCKQASPMTGAPPPTPPRGSACASCKAIQDVPGADVSIIRRLFSAAVEWPRAQPWITLRLNHVIRVDCPWSPEWKYVHVIGGGGNCVPGMYVVRSASELDREDMPGRQMHEGFHGLYAKAHDGAESEYSWETLDYLEDNGIPIISGAGDPDPRKRLVPTFHRYNMGRVACTHWSALNV